jgi:hypothetical protein
LPFSPPFTIDVRGAWVFQGLLRVVGSWTIGVYNQEVLGDVGTTIAAERTCQGLRTRDPGIDSRIIEAIEAGRPGITTTQLATVATTRQFDPLPYGGSSRRHHT